MPKQNYIKSYALLNRLSLAIVIVWLSVIFASLFWNLHMEKQQTRMIAVNVAKGYFAKDLTFRLWGAKHGGVYAPVTRDSPPNPFLSHVPERDIVTPSGKKLTLLNPAYMIRQMMEDFSKITGVGGHLTSLKLLNPINKPDLWEEQQLHAFENGLTEAIAFVEIDGEPTMRLMRPFITKKLCLKCHAHQGYKIGDVRGGTSMSIPMKSYLETERTILQSIIITHLLILLLGLVGIWAGFVLIRKNIAQHIALESDLREKNIFIHDVIEALSHPFLVFDVNSYEIEVANNAALGGAVLSGQTCYSLSHHADKPCSGAEHPCPIKLIKKSRKPVSVEHIHYDSQGRVRNVEIHCYPLFDQNGEVIKLVEYTVDITERRTLLLEKEKLQNQLLQSQKMEAIGQLSGGVAHDFNNLLTAILGYSELAMTIVAEDQPVYEHLDIIHNTGLKAAALTQQLLAFSRKQTIDMQLVYFDSLLEDLLKMVGRLLGEDIKIQLQLNSVGLAIMADPAKLEQVILNLAVNARDAMPRGGKLIFKTEIVDLEHDTVKDHPSELAQGKYLQFQVSDNGEGIEADIKEKVFEPFFTTKELGKGTGLGLSTVFGILKQHNSFIFLDSKLAEGTTITIYFPIYQGEGEGLVDKNAEENLMPTGSEVIMLVDDEPLIIDIMQNALRNLGYTVVAMSNPQDVLAYLDNHDLVIDLLLTDVIMPNMSGKELAELIRLRQPEVKVIYMSGHSDISIAHYGILVDDRQLLQKPIKTAELAVMIRNVFEN